MPGGPITIAQDVTPQQEIELKLHIVGEIYKYAQGLGIPFHLLYIRDPDHSIERYEAMKTFAEQQGLSFKMVPSFKEDRVTGIGHWNAQGHSKAAEIITEMLMGDEVVASRAIAAKEVEAPAAN